MSPRARQVRWEDELLEAFKHFDTDGDGSISADELSHAVYGDFDIDIICPALLHSPTPTAWHGTITTTTTTTTTTATTTTVTTITMATMATITMATIAVPCYGARYFALIAALFDGVVSKYGGFGPFLAQFAARSHPTPHMLCDALHSHQHGAQIRC